MILDLVLIVACALYVAEYLLMLVGLRRSHAMRPVSPERPRVSVVVAARNEEGNIGPCIDALLAQSYPADLYEVVVVDDQSEDATGEIIARQAATHPGRILHISTVEEESHARGKARAIAQGIDRAGGEIILLTDADCLPPPDWIDGIVSWYADDIDVVAGFTLVLPVGHFASVQQLDWLHLQIFGAAALALGRAIGVVGNNLSFRRRAYDAVGGYRSVRFTVTEDFALFRAMHDAGFRSIYPTALQTVMFTRPCPTILDVVRQKQRWAQGATANLLPGGIVPAIALVMLVAFTIAPFVSTFAWWSVWSVKFSCDLILMLPVLRRLRMLRQLRYFFLFEFYFIVQALVVPYFVANRTVVWKGRSYRP